MTSSDHQDDSERVRVVVVGAGVAGLAAANALLSSNCFAVGQVCVLEGSDRVGGRVETGPFSSELPMPVDLGAAWIHGTQGNPFADLAVKFGIEWKEISARNPSMHPGSCDRFQLYDGTSKLSEAEVKETWAWQDLLLDKLHALATEGGSWAAGKPLSEVIDRLVKEDEQLHPLVTSAANGRKRLELCVRKMETYMGATADELQIDDFLEVDLIGDHPGPHCIVPSGMERFIDGLAEPVKSCIRTNTCVTAINYVDKSKVVVETSSGETIEAEYVVVTCSLGFLKSQQLKFEPELPSEKTAAIDRSKMGQYMKVLLQFPSVFWPEDAALIGQIDENTAGTVATAGCGSQRVYFPTLINYYYAKGYPVLESQLVGNQATRALATMTDEEIALALFLQLQDTFGADIPSPVGHFITRWDLNQWSKGAFSCLTVDSTNDDPEILRQSVDKRVFFAGEAAIYKYQGTLQGAYITGCQAAEDILGVAQT